MDFIIPYEFKSIFSTDIQAKQINSIILKYVDRDSIITDATACIGGNSSYFAKDFKYVNCVEINNNTFEILKSNMREFRNKIIYNCSYNIIKSILRQDVIFIDPPWGGSIYKTKKKINLYIDSLNVIDIVDSMYNYCRIIALKVPNNFNRNDISINFWKNRVFSITKNNKSVYKLIIFHK